MASIVYIISVLKKSNIIGNLFFCLFEKPHKFSPPFSFLRKTKTGGPRPLPATWYTNNDVHMTYMSSTHVRVVHVYHICSMYVYVM